MTIISHADGAVSAESVPSSNCGRLVVPDARSGSWTRIAGAWHAAINYLVPIGYEDETGFHYGEMPVPNSTMSLGEKSA
jgi:hypothetical protein